ncbi:MAG TPA: hypothetical protein VHB02_19280 [Acidimicrobiales bacterium]|nr:hypothetical protein [Acidimicrobiales bacterium]
MDAPSVDELLDQADALRLAGRGADASPLYDEVVQRARAAGDLARWTRAALGAASVHVYGTDPGRVPAQMYDLLARTVDDADRARLGAALARCWAYSGNSARARAFAGQSLAEAERAGQPVVLAECLDAALACHWGPDELDGRVRLVARLDEVAAHLLDADARLQAHLWGLQVGCETLDLQSVHRHMRALDRLGEESPRARFFAASRRLMLDLLRGRTDTAPELIAVATAASEQASLSDAWMVIASMRGYTAVQVGDVETCAEVAAGMEAFALGEGSAPVCAEGAVMWLAAGRQDKVRELLHTLHGPVLDELPKDVNWLLTLQCALDAALGVDDRFVIEAASRLLEPYAGRPVVNVGAVMFHGLTDDTLARAAAALGDTTAAAGRRAAALATYTRLGASWWRDRLSDWQPPAAATPNVLRLSPSGDGIWLVGTAEQAVPVKALRGYTYLRELLRRPGVPVPATHLVTGGTGTVEQAAPGPVLDRTALGSYRRRLQELDADIAQAEDWSDTARRETLQAERDALVDELMAATGLGGRDRATGSSRERARVTATKAIATAVDRITAVDGSVGRHLERTIQTGTYCTYQPDRDRAVEWVLD